MGLEDRDVSCIMMLSSQSFPFFSFQSVFLSFFCLSSVSLVLRRSLWHTFLLFFISYVFLGNVFVLLDSVVVLTLAFYLHRQMVCLSGVTLVCSASLRLAFSHFTTLGSTLAPELQCGAQSHSFPASPGLLLLSVVAVVFGNLRIKTVRNTSHRQVMIPLLLAVKYQSSLHLVLTIMNSWRNVF